MTSKGPITAADEALLERALAAAQQAIATFKRGEAPSIPCVFCNRPIEIEGLPPGGPYTQFQTRCPCGKSSGSFKGL
jgi:hypothetical protein